MPCPACNAPTRLKDARCVNCGRPLADSSQEKSQSYGVLDVNVRTYTVAGAFVGLLIGLLIAVLTMPNDIGAALVAGLSGLAAGALMGCYVAKRDAKDLMEWDGD